MSLFFRKFFIILVLGLQSIAMAMMLYDPLHSDLYRRAERLETLQAWLNNPSPSSKSAYDAELSQLHSYLRKKNAVIILVLAVEAVGVYYFWCYVPKKPANEKAIKSDTSI